jgi:putative transcriptional regulator
MSGSLRGQLLVSSPGLLDPNFRRTVILIVAHDDDGAVGLVLNRRSETDLSEAVPELADIAGSERVVSVGGPVQSEAVIVLAEWDDVDEAGTIVFEDVGLMAAESDLELVEAATRRVRIFAGYAGWSAGQLEAELAEPSWILAAAAAEDVFDDDPDLWGNVLRRKGGAFRLIATMPEDPTLN